MEAHTSRSQLQKATDSLKALINDLQSEHKNVLPTESELAAELGMGRNTVRKAIAEFEEKGLLERIRGKGTFITQQTRELTFSNWVSEEITSELFLSNAIGDFQDNHPDVSIREISIPYHAYLQKILSLILNDQSPDIIQVTPFWLRRLQKLNIFTPISGYVSQNIIKRRYTTAIDLGKVNGELFALNWALCPQVLYYNKVVMEEAGLDPDTPPKTMDELAEMSIKVNECQNENLHGFCMPTELFEYSFFDIYPLFLAFGGGFSDPIGNIIVDSEETIRALSWLKDFYKRGGVKKENSVIGVRILFASNHLAFMVDGPYGRGNFRQLSGMGKEFDKNYGVTTIPSGPNGRTESVMLTHGLAVSKYCRDPETAYSFIERLSTDEIYAKYYFDEFGMIPCNRDLLHKPQFIADPFASVFLKQLENITNGPIDHPLFFKALPYFLQAVSNVVIHDHDPAESLKLVKEIINMIAQNDYLLFP